MAARKSAKAATSSGARTIVYVHGIANKPPEDVLRCQWDKALLGFGQGERSRMAYWCQRDRHGAPLDETCTDADNLTKRAERAARMGARALREDVSLTEFVDKLTQGSAAERAVLRKLAARLEAAPTAPRRAGAARMRAEGLGEEWNAPDFVTRMVTRMFLIDVRDFFFDARRRQAMKDSVRRRLVTGGGPFVLVAHSQGTMIAYEVLRELSDEKADVQVDLFLTIGSPLGLEEARDQINKHLRGRDRDRMPFPGNVRRWFNVYDPKDPVARGTALSDFYRGDLGVEERVLDNLDHATDPHSATGYLALSEVRQHVRDRLELERFQRVAHFTVAADVVADHERHEGERRPLLIELTDPAWALRQREREIERGRPVTGEATPLTTEQMADEVLARIRKVVPADVGQKELRVQRLKRYLSVQLTREETEKLAHSETLAKHGLTVRPLYRVWRNAKRRALLETSIHTVQASAAHLSYEALGQGIDWAVLDSGCAAHPHFDTYGTIVARWDCTRDTDQPVRDAGPVPRATRDGYGHGTHVAGIIAGRYTQPAAGRRPERSLSGIAPRARLHVYKVLGNDGTGDDAWIIKAINHVADINDRAGTPVIAGVNLSLGGPYEQEVFGCGFTPLCEELRRLWRQGVVVVLAAGNEGYARLLTNDGPLDANLPFTIGDPANLQEAIAVGSIHKERPHTYGVSNFSSRGPTVDGRVKPDCVAPGEQILSCRHDPPKGATAIADLYYRLDGTSMAAPHVSGLIAAFLSRRREFIGDPDRIKQILLEQCTDLGRERQQQGAGMPNLVKMLVST